jgi:hypothetical protein
MLSNNVENDATGHFLEYRMMCRVEDTARKTAVDSCTFKAEAWSMRVSQG